MSEIVEFPKSEQPPILIGPFQVWHVVVGGRKIPHLTGTHTSDGGINFIVDGRLMGGPFYGETAHQAAWLLAQALAVGSGYSNFEAETKDRVFAPLTVELGEAPHDH